MSRFADFQIKSIITDFNHVLNAWHNECEKLDITLIINNDCQSYKTKHDYNNDFIEFIYNKKDQSAIITFKNDYRLTSHTKFVIQGFNINNQIINFDESMYCIYNQNDSLEEDNLYLTDNTMELIKNIVYDNSNIIQYIHNVIDSQKSIKERIQNRQQEIKEYMKYAKDRF